MRTGTVTNFSPQSSVHDYYVNSSNTEIIIIIIVTIAAMFAAYKLFHLLFPHHKYVYKLGYPDDRVIVFNTKNWLQKEGRIVSYDYSNMEGGNSISKRDYGNYLNPDDAPRIDSIVLVVEYKNEINGKNIPVVVLSNNKKFQIGDIIKIKVNPENPLEAFII